ncbi:hypothetical protein U9M48_036987 [Paspalum notatum var. saurae]|uniref:Calmodulin-binding protein n=1 Tax=Paspalum notatum var. saurae TaxID=547442 RepID=A0AAQ3UIP5_PASNO
MERERGMVRQPPAKRMKLAAAVVPAGVGVGSGGGEVASPRSRVTLRQTLLMVLFLVRARNTVAASVSQIGRMLQRYVDGTFHKYHVMISSYFTQLLLLPATMTKFRNITFVEVIKLDGFQEQIEGLRHEVTCLSRLCSNRHADQQTSLTREILCNVNFMLLCDRVNKLEGNQEHVAANGSNPNIWLFFQDGLKPSVYTDENLTSENDAAIKLAMYEGKKVVKSGALSQAKVEILVLRGDFSNKCRDNWTEEEFDKYIVQGRDGHDLVLGTVWLTNGEVELSQIRFKEGSCRKKVIMAARVCKSEKIVGRIQEAIMKNPVIVLDRRNKPNEKRHPPRLDDDLYRLEEIARDGVYHKRLLQAKIYNVEGLLKALNQDSNKLRGILKMEKQQNAWSKLTEHARECVLEDKQELKRYQNEEGNVVLFFNCVHDVVGAAFPREYAACQRFDLAQKALVNKWRRHAYDKLDGISPDFVLRNDIPKPISSSTDFAAAPSVLAVGTSTSRQIFSANQLAPYQGTEGAEYLSHNKHVMEPISPIINCDPTVRDGLNTTYYQGTGTAANLPQDEHVDAPFYPTANYGPIITDPDDLNTRYCQDQGIPQHGQQQMISPCPQNPQGLIDFPDPTEFPNFDLYPSTPAHLSQPGSAGPAASPPWTMAQLSVAEQDQGPTCSWFPGSGYANHFR